MVKGGVIMDVINVEQVRIVEEVGVVFVMVFYCVFVDIRKVGGVVRMVFIEKIQEIMDVVIILVMVKVRIGYVVEVKIFEVFGVDMIDESEVFIFLDLFFYIDKCEFIVFFVCGVRNFGEVVRRIWEGVVMIRIKGEVGIGNIVEVVRYVCFVVEGIRQIQVMIDDQVYVVVEKFVEFYFRFLFNVKEIVGFLQRVFDNELIYGYYIYCEIVDGFYKIFFEIKKFGRFLVVNFVVGGVVIFVDVVLMMQMGMDGVFVGFGIFKSFNLLKMVKVIVEVVNYWDEFDVFVEISKEIGELMCGQDIEEFEVRFEERGV